MSLSLKNKTALVTGSTDGLGKLIAINLVELGANVIVHSHDKNKIDDTVKMLSNLNSSSQVSYINCDLRNISNIEYAFSKIDSLDILVNNAGIWLEDSIETATSAQISDLMNVNLTGAILVTKSVFPALTKSEFGQILNIVSMSSLEIHSDYFHTVYTAAKFGLRGFTESLSKEHKDLRVMGIYPGRMDTGFFGKSINASNVKTHPAFNPKETAESAIFMLTRDRSVNVKSLEIISH